MEKYEVYADNCNCPNITYHVKGLSAHAAIFAAEHLSQGFRDVRVVNEETGEVMLNKYYNDHFYKPTMSEVECLSIAQNILAE